MVGSIQFPHLGIRLEHVIKSVSIGGFEIACYGMVLAAAMATGRMRTPILIWASLPLSSR